MSQPRSGAPAASRAVIRELLGTRVIAYYPAFAAIAGGVSAGVFPAQLYYWDDKGRDPDGWIYKTQPEWERETGLTLCQQRTARRQLRDRRILEGKTAGLPARLHYRLDVARVIELLNARAAGGARGSAPEARGCVPTPAPGSDGQGEKPRPSTKDPAIQACGAASDTVGGNARSSSKESCMQACRVSADKHAGILSARMQDSSQHAETTRKHSSQQETEKTAAAAAAVSAAGAAAGSSDVYCSIHHVPMALRCKDGDRWYSHRLSDGTWCKGAARDPPDGRCDLSSIESRRQYLAWADPALRRSASGPNGGRDPP